MKLKNILVFICCLNVLSCSYSTKELKSNNHSSSKKNAIQNFIKRNHFINLPQYFDLDKDPQDTLQPLVLNQSDTLLFSENNSTGALVLGISKDTSSFYTIIVFYAASSYIPAIVTFDKNGNEISNEQLLVKGTRVDCGYYGKSTGYITKDLKIFAMDSLNMYTCDSLGNETLGTREHYIEYFNGYIDNNGKIHKSKIAHRNIN